MTSRQIFDHPHLLDELPLLNLTKATKRFPVPTSKATVERWIRSGVRGVQLETVLVGNRRYTTDMAIQRFLIGQQSTAPENARRESKQGSMSKRELDEASRKFGLPKPLQEPSQN